MTQTDLMTAPTLQPGQLIARGVTRQLAALGFASV
ncbi:MAG: DNA repair protein MmcB-related protein, partial [Sulfitobacter sp.]|nr:DNA repair protein MmcB-related protein [Sulfitobacter sp.]